MRRTSYEIIDAGATEKVVLLKYSDGSEKKKTYQVITMNEIAAQVRTNNTIYLDGKYVFNFSINILCEMLKLEKKEHKFRISANHTFFDGGTNFNETNFEGNVNFSQSDFSNQYVDFIKTDFGEGDTNFTDVNFGDGSIYFIDSHFDKGSAIFSNTGFGNGHVSFSGANFGNMTTSFHFANFGDGTTDFSHVNFGDGDIYFNYANFGNSTVNFSKSKFGNDNASFKNTVFGNGSVFFSDSNFGKGDIDFSGSSFKEGNVDFGNTTFDIGSKDFSHVNFGTCDVSFLGANFGEGNVSFRNSSFSEGKVNFDNLHIDGNLNFAHNVFKCVLRLNVANADQINFNDCINYNIIDMSYRPGSVKYLCFDNMTNLGNIKLNWDGYKKALDAVDDEDKKIDQYIMLKQNYNDLGNYDWEDEVYLEYRRLATNKIDNPLKKAVYTLLDKIGGYGTKPFNVFKTMFIIVFCFGVIYYLFPGGIQKLPEGVTIHRTFCIFPKEYCNNILDWWGGFYYSLITFLTVGYGDYSAQNGWIALFAGIEAFLGVFLMSYFSVALVRKILR